MGSRDPRVDAYIAKSREFARPILTHIRDVVHAACPEVEEAMKWSMPHFMYHGMLCGMAAFREHCSLGFWKAALLMKEDARSRDAMGQFGCIRSVDDLPSRTTLTRYVKAAMRLNETGETVPRRAKPARPVRVPTELRAALTRHPEARAAFERFSPSHRREYAEWILEAKRPETRERRVATAIEWIAEGKSRNWKYVRS